MGSKIAAFILTTIACLAAAVVLFFGMILAMNGYSESDAIWGMGAFGVLAVIVALLAGGGAILMTGRLTAREFRPVSAVAGSVITFSAFGAVAEFICCIIGVLVAELVRTQF